MVRTGILRKAVHSCSIGYDSLSNMLLQSEKDELLQLQFTVGHENANPSAFVVRAHRNLKIFSVYSSYSLRMQRSFEDILIIFQFFPK